MDKFDKRFKDNKDEKLPSSLDEKIESLLLDIENGQDKKINKNKSFNYKKIAMAASLSAVVLSGLGISAVAETSDRSIKEVVYDILGYDGEKDLLTDIYKSQEKNGIGFTITRAGFVDNRVIASYTIKSKEYVEFLKKKEYSNLYAVPMLYLNGELLSGGGSSGYEVLSDSEVAGTFELKEENLKDYIGDESKKLELDVAVYIEDNMTNFKTEIPLLEELIIESKTYDITTEIGLDNEFKAFPSRLNSITVSPLNIMLNYTDKYIKGKTEKETEDIIFKLSDYEVEQGQGDTAIKMYESIDYAIIDDKGKVLEFVGGAGSYDMDIEYIANPNMKKLYIIPFVHSFADENYKMHEDKKIKGRVKNGVLRLDESKDFTFTYEDFSDKTRIHMTANTEFMRYGVYLDLGEKELDKIYDINDDGAISNEEMSNAAYKSTTINSGYIDIPGRLEDGEYTFAYPEFKYTNAFLDDVVEVDLETK